jgi:hypothetical protein
MFKRGAPSLGHALFMVICVIMVLMTLIFRWRFLNTKYRNGLIFIAVSASFSTVQDVVGVLGSLSNAEQWTGNTIEGITTTAGIFFLVRGTKHLNAQANKRVCRTVFIGIFGSVVVLILGILKHFGFV